MDCPSCERIERYFFDETSVWFGASLDHTIEKLAGLGAACGADMERVSDRLIRIDLSRNGLNQLATLVAREIRGQELGQIRVFTTPVNRTPDVQDLVRVFSGQEFLARLNADWLADSLSNLKFETWFQQVVRQTKAGERSVYGHDARFRVKDSANNVLTGSDALRTAAGTDLHFTLDLMSRRNAVETAGKYGLPGKLFISFNPASIYDPEYCLKSTAATIEECGLTREQVVFELDPRLSNTGEDHVLRIVNFYRDHHFGVALGRLDLSDKSSHLLRSVKPDYAVLGPQLVRKVNTDDFGQAQVESLLDVMEMLGATPIAVGVDYSEELDWLSSVGVELFLGDYFGPAAPAKTLV